MLPPLNGRSSRLPNHYAGRFADLSPNESHFLVTKSAPRTLYQQPSLHAPRFGGCDMPDKSHLSSIYFPLRLAYGLVPIVAGADKFTNLLTDWQKYLAPQAESFLPVSPATFMMIVGVIEIIAGLLVLAILPRLGSYIVAIWLVLIAANLILAGYYDIAVRDLVMALGAYVLGQAAALHGDEWFPSAHAHGTTAHVAAS
jgi:uncharacterized membrane protein YphA (DoxX/SURF4 family)